MGTKGKEIVGQNADKLIELLNKAAAMILLGQEAVALKVYENIEKLYGRDRAPNVREQVAVAKVSKQALESSLG